MGGAVANKVLDVLGGDGEGDGGSANKLDDFAPLGCDGGGFVLPVFGFHLFVGDEDEESRVGEFFESAHDRVVFVELVFGMRFSEIGPEDIADDDGPPVGEEGHHAGRADPFGDWFGIGDDAFEIHVVGLKIGGFEKLLNGLASTVAIIPGEKDDFVLDDFCRIERHGNDYALDRGIFLRAARKSLVSWRRDFTASLSSSVLPNIPLS